VPANPNPDLPTDPNLSTNLLYPSIRLFVLNDTTGAKPHLPLQEHAYRIPNGPNTFFYVLPHQIQYDIAVFVRNFDSKPVSLLQRCNPTHGKCLDPKMCPANAEIELPLRVRYPRDGIDILNSDTNEVLMHLRFDGKPIPPDFLPYRREGGGWTWTHAPPDAVPALATVPHETRAQRIRRLKNADFTVGDPDAVPRPHDPDSRIDQSPHESPGRHDPTTPQSPWWPWSRGAKTKLPEGTHCDVIDEHACPSAPDETDHAALLTHMRALLVAV
jgi:hypothetical protein